MPLPKSSGKLRKPRPFLLRRVSGDSMLPRLRPGQLVLAVPLRRRLQPGQLVIVRHDGLEKVKRIERLDGNRVFVVGDNPADSTDSRQFGWLDRELVVARVLLPRR